MPSRTARGARAASDTPAATESAAGPATSPRHSSACPPSAAVLVAIAPIVAVVALVPLVIVPVPVVRTVVITLAIAFAGSWGDDAACQQSDQADEATAANDVSGGRHGKPVGGLAYEGNRKGHARDPRQASEGRLSGQRGRPALEVASPLDSAAG